MRNFQIKELEALSGIKTHTLRIWEQRYGFLKPERNQVNFRNYSVDQLGLLLNAVLLNRNGQKISQIATLEVEEIEKRASQLKDSEDQKTKAVNDLLIHMYRMNVEAFQKILDESFANWSPVEAAMDIIYPFLMKSGLLLLGNRLTEEHFVVTAIRQKLLTCVDGLQSDQSKDSTILFFLPEGRSLDLLLLYALLIYKNHGYKVLYMGSDVTSENLRSVIDKKRPDVMYTYFPTRSKVNLTDVSNELSRINPAGKIIVVYNDDERRESHQDSNLMHLNVEQSLEYANN